MLIKIYWMAWLAVAVAAAAILAAGAFSALATVAFGFIFFGLVFMGMIAVLPTMAAHPEPPKHREVTVPAKAVHAPAAREAYGVLKSA